MDVTIELPPEIVLSDEVLNLLTKIRGEDDFSEIDMTEWETSRFVCITLFTGLIKNLSEWSEMSIPQLSTSPSSSDIGSNLQKSSAKIFSSCLHEKHKTVEINFL